MQRVIPNLWFDNQSEEAANFYASVFDNAKVLNTSYYTDAGKEQHGHNAGEVMTVDFEIEGLRFVAINGGPIFKINPSISFFVRCSTTEEVDELWAKLSEGGEALMPLDAYPFSKRYGWTSDKFGVSWQIILTEGEITQKIVPSLMFTQEQAGKSEEAINLYTSVFPQSYTGTISRYEDGQGPDAGTINYGEFTIFGQQFVVMDSAQVHKFSFNEAVSLLVKCDTQEEIDNYWSKLSAFPEAEQCGWLKDKYGVSWQIVPNALGDMLSSGSTEQKQRVIAAFMQMKKFDIKALKQAFEQD